MTERIAATTMTPTSRVGHRSKPPIDRMLPLSRGVRFAPRSRVRQSFTAVITAANPTGGARLADKAFTGFLFFSLLMPPGSCALVQPGADDRATPRAERARQRRTRDEDGMRDDD